jgi:hypothetical protein
MIVEDLSPEKLATLLHHYREALAPDFGLASNVSTEWEELSAPERQRMIAATRLALLDLRTAKSPTAQTCRRFPRRQPQAPRAKSVAAESRHLETF